MVSKLKWLKEVSGRYKRRKDLLQLEGYFGKG